MKRILYISDRYPAADHGAGERALSIYNSLQRIAEVDLLLIATPGTHLPRDSRVRVVQLLEDDSRATRWYWRRRAYLLRDFRRDPVAYGALRELTRENRYDALFGRYHLPFLTGAHLFGPSFIDVDDLPMDTWSSPVPGFNAVRRVVFQRALSHQATVFVTKRADARRLGHRDVRILPCISTMPDRTGPARGLSLEGRMLFVGGQDWPPNREGITRFITESLPIVRAKSPSSQLRVVGRFGSALNGPEGVNAADFVPELLPEYEQASIVVCPVRRGGGSAIKLAEAAAYGKAIVATPYAIRGYEGILEAGRDLLVAESDQEFADACVQLLRDAGLRETLATNAQRAAASCLSQAAIDGIIREALLPRMT